MTGLMVAPPLLSDPSGATYAKEREDTLASLARRAAKVTDKLIHAPAAVYIVAALISFCFVFIWYDFSPFEILPL